MPAPTWPPPEWFPEARNPAPLPGDEAGQRVHAEPYTTKLQPHHEQEFRSWLAVSRAPFDPSPRADYDMRGFWLALRNGDARATTAMNQSDKQLHFPDTWKTPFHESFSNESIYAGEDAPAWRGDVLVDKHGRIVADERPKAGR